MRAQLGILLDKDLNEMLRKHAENDYSTRAAIGRKCIALTLPLLVKGIPASVFEAMAGDGKKR